MLDFYCERTDPGLFNEPLNLITNLAFVAAAFLALGHLRRQPGLGFTNGWDLVLLVGLLFAIGVGSGLFHAFANRWSLLADVIPILLFINLYLVSWLYRVVGLPWWGALLGLVAYQALNLGWTAVVGADAFNGSAGYAPALFFLLGMAVYLGWRGHPMVRSTALAAILFSSSLVFRTLDHALCAGLSLGTHFLWHLLNGVVLYLLLIGLIDHRTSGRLTSRS